MSCTSIHVAFETREIEPTPSGWRQIEATGDVTFACSCGANCRGSSAEVPALAAPHVRRIGEVSRA
jgi:hypothetical protein